MTDEQNFREYCLTQAEGALGLLGSIEREDAERLLVICRQCWLSGLTDPEKSLSIEVRQLSEVLARRGAKAMPFGALGRALLAHLNGASLDSRALLIEFQAKLGMLGL